MLFHETPPEKMVIVFREACDTYVGPIRRPQVHALLDYLEKADFFVAPASSSMNFHLGCRGGLAMHVWNFFWWMRLMIVGSLGDAHRHEAVWVAEPSANVLHLQTMLESAFIIALCHDLNKTTIFGKSFYVVNMTTKGQSAYKPYEVSKERVPLNHHDGIMLASAFLDLKADEAQAITYCEGKYDWGYRAVEGKEEVLLKYAVCADFLSSKVQEDYPGIDRSHATFRQTIAQVLGGPGPAPDLFVVPETSTPENTPGDVDYQLVLGAKPGEE